MGEELVVRAAVVVRELVVLADDEAGDVLCGDEVVCWVDLFLYFARLGAGAGNFFKVIEGFLLDGPAVGG